MSKVLKGTIVGGGNWIKQAAGGSGPTTVTTSANIPGFVSDFQQNLFGQAQNTANQLGARQFANFSPLQQQGFSFLSGINDNAGITGAQNALSSLQGMNFGAGPINAMNVGGTSFDAASINRGDIRNVAAQNFLQGDITGYINPYQQQVVDASMNDIERARQLQQQQVNAQALARGAFGGSRQAVAESENSRNYLDQQARTIAGLRQQGFDTAANIMQADMNRALQADVSNQGIDYNVGAQNAGFLQGARQFGAESALQASLANQRAQLQAAQVNAANELQAQQMRAAAQEAAMTGGLNLNRTFLGNADAQLQAGALQQALDQQRMDAERNLPMERLGLLSDVFRGGQLPYGTSQTTPAQKPNYLGLALGAAGVAGGLGWRPLASTQGSFLSGGAPNFLSGGNTAFV